MTLESWNYWNRLRIELDPRNTLTCNYYIMDVFPGPQVKTSMSYVFSSTGMINGHGNYIHPESFLRTYNELRSYLDLAPKEYVDGFFDFRKFFSELIDIRRRYIYFRSFGPLGEHLFWSNAPNMSFIFNNITKDYKGFVQWWFHSPLVKFTFSHRNKYLHSLIYGQHFYSGFINNDLFIDCYFVFEPKNPTNSVQRASSFLLHFPIEEEAAFDFVVRFGDGKNDYIRWPIFESLDCLKQVQERFNGVLPSSSEDVFNPEHDLDLLADERLLLAYAATNFLEIYEFNEDFEGKKYIGIKRDKAFFSLLDAFQSVVGLEARWEWPAVNRGADGLIDDSEDNYKGAARSVPPI